MIGNHCLYNLDRHTLINTLGMTGEAAEEEEGSLLYYSHLAAPGVRLVVLDGYDVSFSWPAGTKKGDLAREMLAKGRLRCQHDNVNSPAKLEGLAKRWVAFNGAVGETQVNWLKGVLAAAKSEKERVILISHNPLHPKAAAPQCLLWNHQEILDVLARYTDTLALCLAGHSHAGGFCRDDAGIAHRCLEAIVECPPGTTAHGILHVFADRVEIEGSGGMYSQTIYFADALPGLEPHLLDEQSLDWRRPHGHGLAGGMDRLESERLQQLERARG